MFHKSQRKKRGSYIRFSWNVPDDGDQRFPLFIHPLTSMRYTNASTLCTHHMKTGWKCPPWSNSWIRGRADPGVRMRGSRLSSRRRFLNSGSELVRAWTQPRNCSTPYSLWNSKLLARIVPLCCKVPGPIMPRPTLAKWGSPMAGG